MSESNSEARSSPTSRGFLRVGKRTSQLLGALLIFGGLLLIALHRMQPDWLAPVTMVPAWMWLVVVLLAMFVARNGGRRVLGSVFAVWLVFAFLHIDEVRGLVNFNRISVLPQTSNKTLRVGLLNCCVGNENAALEIAKYLPDVVLFQESVGAARMPEVVAKMMGDEGQFLHGGDCAIVVKGKIKPKLVDPSRHFVHAVATLKNGLAVDVVSLRLSPPVFRIDFWNVGFWSDHRAKRLDHRRQLREIVEHLDGNQETSFLIIGGDFNLVARDGALDVIDKNLTDAYGGGAGWCGTGTSQIPLFRVDQIWTNSKCRCEILQAFRSKHSDHRMVVADFELK